MISSLIKITLTFIFLLNINFAKADETPTISSLKAEIFKLAESFVGQTDPDGSKQKKLEVLVNKLRELIPEQTMQERAMDSVGVWNQVWGPYAFDGSDTVPPGQDPRGIYQYISPDGFYYNFGEYNFLGLNIKFFVRGDYRILDDRIRVEFTDHGLVKEKEVNYLTLGEELESGTARRYDFPRSLPPVGVEGALVEVYADDEIRINYGVQGQDLSDKTIFIMRKVQ